MVNNELTIVAYSSDWWEHVCPSVRIIGPGEALGLNIIKGNEWVQGVNSIYPERVYQADIVIIQRDFPRYYVEYQKVLEIARDEKKKIIYELDDLLTEVSSDHPDRNHYLQARASILKAIIDADAVIGSTLEICDYSRLWNPNVWHFPNYLDDRLWLNESLVKESHSEDESSIIIGYMGGHSHLSDLEMICPVLRKLIEKYEEKIKLKFFGVLPPTEIREFDNVEYSIPGLVNYAEFVEYFRQQTIDIFIAPLISNLFNFSKSHLKYLEYSILGVPGVYSNVPSYRQIITNGENGFLATTQDEWDKYLTILIEDDMFRLKMGEKAQKTVEDKWLLSRNANKWLSIFEAVQSSIDHAVKNYEKSVDFLISWYLEYGEIFFQYEQDNKVERSEFQKKLADLEIKFLESESQVADQRNTIELQKLHLEKQFTEIDQIKNKLSEQENKLVILESSKKELRETVRVLEKQNDTYQKEIRALKKQNIEQQQNLFDIKSNLNNITFTLNEIYISKAWRFILFIRKIRTVLFPVGSWRDRILRKIFTGIKIWRRQGLKFLFSVLRGKISHQSPLTPQNVLTNRFSAEPGEKCPSPAISVIFIKDNTFSDIREDAVRAWCKKQTISKLIDVIVWNHLQDGVIDDSEKTVSRDFSDYQSLLDQISSPYVCIASDDLLSQNETYLEYNLIALATEDLVFTLNLNGISDWALPQIAQGCLPGNEHSKLLRQVVRKDFLRKDLSVDLDLWMGEKRTKSAVVGKVLKHTTEFSDTNETLEFSNRFENHSLILSESYLHIDNGANIDDSQSFSRIIHPVDSVIPVLEKPDERPTVLVVQTYLAVGGAERVALNMMESLKNEIRFVILMGVPMDISLGTTADLHREITPFVYTIPDYLNWNLNYSHLVYLIESFKPEALYIANGVGWVYDAISVVKQKYPNIRLVNQVYDFVEGWINRYDTHLISYIDANIGANARIGKAFSDLGITDDRIFIVPHRISVDDFNPDLYTDEHRKEIKNKLGLPVDSKVITFISRIHSQKRPMDFVELARRFADDTSMVFLMVGDGPLADVVDAEVRRISLNNFIQLPFYKPSSDIFAITDVMVLPSEYEGMPMVILEAQAMGVPVVVTDVGNNKEVIDLTQGGIVVPRIGDVTVLYQGLHQVLENRPDTERMREVITEKFSIKMMGKEYRDALLGRP